MYYTAQREIFREKKKKTNKLQLQMLSLQWSDHQLTDFINQWPLLRISGLKIFICIAVGFSIWREGPEKTIPIYLCSSKRDQLSTEILWRISCLVVQKLPKTGRRSQKARSCHWPKQTNKDPQQKITLPQNKNSSKRSTKTKMDQILNESLCFTYHVARHSFWKLSSSTHFSPPSVSSGFADCKSLEATAREASVRQSSLNMTRAGEIQRLDDVMC